MLRDRDCPKIAKNAQQQKNESRINKVPSVCVAKLSPDQFSQRWREVAPGIRISDRLERKRKSLPRGKGEERRYPTPVAESPGRCSTECFAACGVFDHFTRCGCALNCHAPDAVSAIERENTWVQRMFGKEVW